MKRVAIISFLIFTLFVSLACRKHPGDENKPGGIEITEKMPLTDLTSGTFRGFRGGLYPDGSNERPPAHQAAGLAIANAIKPLNSEGIADEVNGRIVWMSVGMSNTTQETSAFLAQMKDFPGKHPKLVLVDGAQGGQDINRINNAAATYWDSAYKRLSYQGVTKYQVQVIWYKEAEASPKDTAFATYPDALKGKFLNVMQLLKTKFPNLKMVYLSNRIYAGYASSGLNPEPFAWYTGWAVKRLIEEQLKNNPSLRFSGDQPSSAWLSWGPDLWANGATPRSDGLTWLPSDFASDGTHPGKTGTKKVADLLFKFFTTDETTKPWFLKP